MLSPLHTSLQLPPQQSRPPPLLSPCTASSSQLQSSSSSSSSVSSSRVRLWVMAMRSRSPGRAAGLAGVAPGVRRMAGEGGCDAEGKSAESVSQRKQLYEGLSSIVEMMTWFIASVIDPLTSDPSAGCGCSAWLLAAALACCCCCCCRRWKAATASTSCCTAVSTDSSSESCRHTAMGGSQSGRGNGVRAGHEREGQGVGERLR